MTPRRTISAEKRSTFASSRLCESLAAIAALIAVAMGMFQPRKLDAYALEGPKWPNGSTVTMQLSMGNAGRTLADGNTSWNSAVAPALDNWNAIVANMRFAKVMNSTAAVSSGDRVNSMAFSSTNFGQSFGSNTLAVTTYWFSGSTMSEADILFNSNQPWDSYRGALRSGGYDIQRVALHESGHALGLAHSSVSSAIMYPYINNTYTLTSDDIAGAQAMYGAATSTPTPTPTPSPTATATPTATPSTTPTATPTPTPGSGAAVMQSPASGSTFTSSSVTFSWSAGSATTYALKVGSSPGAMDFYGAELTSLSTTVNQIATDGRTIYVTLYSKVNNSWLSNNYSYTAFSASSTPTPTPTPTATPSATPTPTPSSNPAVSLMASPTSIRTGSTSTFTVTAAAPVSSATTVRYSLSGAATLGINYTLSGTPGQFTIPAGASSATVTLTIEKIGRTGKSATMTLNSGAGYSLSPPTSASVFMRQ